MDTEITVSAKGQVVIPSETRKALGLRPGSKLSFHRSGEVMTIRPVPKLKKRSAEETWRELDALFAKRKLPPPPSDDEMNAAIDRMFRERSAEFLPPKSDD